MQLKIRRFEEEGGLIFKHVVYCLDARLELTAEETALIKKHDMMGAHIYNSLANAPDEDSAHERAHPHSGVKTIDITTRSLLKGVVVKCKDESITREAEENIIEACEGMRGFFQSKSQGEREIVMKDDDFD